MNACIILRWLVDEKFKLTPTFHIGYQIQVVEVSGTESLCFEEFVVFKNALQLHELWDLEWNMAVDISNAEFIAYNAIYIEYFNDLRQIILRLIPMGIFEDHLYNDQWPP